MEPLRGRSVNVKAYRHTAAGIDISPHPRDHLVLCGSAKATRTMSHRPWRITDVYLFESQRLLAALTGRGVRVGVATSLRAADWAAARLFPESGPNPPVTLTAQQRAALALFA